MKETLEELNKEICAIHLKPARCRITNEGIEFNTCCRAFTDLLNAKLKEINNRIAQQNTVEHKRSA